MQRRSNSQSRNQPRSRNQFNSNSQRNYTQGDFNHSHQRYAPSKSLFSKTDPAKIELSTDKVEFYNAEKVNAMRKEDPRFIKEVVEESVLDPSVLVKDISLLVSGPAEDDVFLGDPHLWVNIRRGNTLLELYDPQDFQKRLKVVYARKGMNKFFDIKLDFIRKETRYEDKILDDRSYDLKLNILGPVRKATLQGHKVEIIKSLKANGENTQISFSKELDSWVIASKNVSVFAQTEKDLDLYPKSKARYNFAIMMAEAWFDIINNGTLNKKEVEDLKKDLTNRTLVGEYIGNPSCQHLVKYPKETIVFFGIVNNYLNQICCLNEESMKFFKAYKLNTVDMVTVGVYSDYDEFCDAMVKEFYEISKCTISQEEEGAVFYFIKRDPENHQKDQVLSMTKLKTLEYRLFRKIREKLRNFIDGKTQLYPEQIKERFLKEAKDLTKGFDLPRPFDFYLEMFLTAMRLITQGPKKDQIFMTDMLMEEYVNFLEEVNLEVGHKKRKLQIKVDFNSQILNRQNEIDYQAPSIKRQVFSSKQEEKQESKAKSSPQKNQYKPKEQGQDQKQQKTKARNIINKTIFLISPPSSITCQGIDVLKRNFNFIEASEFTSSLYDKPQQNVDQVNLVLVPQLNGIKENNISHTEQLYFLNFKFEQDYLNYEMAQNVLDPSNYCPEILKTQLQTLQGYSSFLNQQIANLKETVESLQKRANYSSDLSNEDELFKKIQSSFLRLTNSSKVFNLVKELRDMKKQVAQPTPDQGTYQQQEQGRQEEVKEKKKVKIQEPTKKEIANGNRNKILHQPHNPQQKMIALIVPIGIPGMGKSHFLKHQLKPYFQKQGFGFSSLSSDGIRRELMDIYLSENPSKTEDDAMANTGIDAAREFSKRLEELITKASEQSSNNREIIYLDKNHPPRALTVTEQIEKISSKYPDVKFIKLAMVPQIRNSYQNYPFSLTFLTQCFTRNLNRDQHDTLTNEDPVNLAKIEIMFFNLYKQMKFDKGFLEKHKFDSFFEIPFTYEHEDLQLPHNLEVALKDAIEKFNLQIDESQKLEAYKKFYNLIKVYQQFFSGYQKTSYDYQSSIDKVFLEVFPKLPESIIKRPSDTNLISQEFASSSKNSENQQALDIREVHSVPQQITQSQEQSTTQKKEKKGKKQPQKQQQQQQSNRFEEVKQTTSQYKPYTPKVHHNTSNGSNSNQLGFEETVGRKSKQNQRKTSEQEYDEDYFDDRIPLYLSISVQNDPKLLDNLNYIIEKEVQLALNVSSQQNITQTVQDVHELVVSRKQYHKGWKWIQNYHVTCDYLNRDEYLAQDSQIYQSFQEGVNIGVTICGIVIVPNKIITGICFPNHPISNKCPHMTLLTNEWNPKMSNQILDACFFKGKAPLREIYDELSQHGYVGKPDNQIKEVNVKYDKNQASVNAYFVALPQPIKFQGVTKIEW